MEKKPVSVEEITREYREIYLDSPALQNLDFFKNPKTNKHLIEATYGFADPTDDMPCKSVSLMNFDTSTDQVEHLNSVSSEDLTVVLQRYSPTGKYKALIKASKMGMIIEVYNRQAMLLIRQIVPFTTHMAVIRKSNTFITNGIAWSKDENRFMYMADDPKPTTQNFFKAKELGITRFMYEDIPGERIQGHTYPTIFVFDLEAKTLFRVLKPKEVAGKSREVFAQPQFADSKGHDIVCISFNMINITESQFFTNVPKKLEYLKGLTVDKIRVGLLDNKYVIPQRTEFDRTKNGIEEDIVYFPKVGPDSRTCAYIFAKKAGNASSNDFGLRTFDLQEPLKAPETIIDITGDDNGVFAGICGFNFLFATWTWFGTSRIVFSAAYHQVTNIYEVNMLTKEVKNICKPLVFQCEAHQVLGALDETHLLAKRDTIFRNNLFYVLVLQKDSTYKEIALHDPYTPPVSLFEETIKIETGAEATFFGNKDDPTPLEERGCILYVHGGPHVIWTNNSIPIWHFMLKRGHTVLNVNYTGSTGQGQKRTEGNHGKGTTLEQLECHLFVQQLIESKKVDPKEIKLFGGSYGGNVGMTYCGNYPKEVKAMSIFNPPCEILSLWTESVFSGMATSLSLGNNNWDFDNFQELTDEETLKVNPHSIIFNHKPMDTEVLLFGGLKDSVVTRWLNRRLYQNLRRHNVKIDLIEYPSEEHMIMTPPATFDWFVKTSLLFLGQWEFDA